LPATLASLAAVDPGRAVAVCRELTKVHEEVVRGSARELSERFAEAPKGEVTLVIGAATAKEPVDTREATAAVAELVAAGLPRRRAVEVIARLTGVPRNSLYRESL
jgi:16S rRNA (cytidine1402-2'-O)-methyltransferase